jgi:16S rRNA (cytosine967-C5)-methyltransferase
LADPATPAEAPRSPPLSVVLTEAGGVIRAVMAGRSLTEMLADVPAALRPATMDLAIGAMRHLARYRFVLDRLLARPATDVEIPGLLLAALHALHARPQEEHMVVDQAVTAAASINHGAAKGLVNAVLRNFLRQRAVLVKAADHDPVTRYSYPAWWIARLRRAYPDVWETILTTGNEHPPMSLRVHRARIGAAAYLEHLKNVGIEGRLSGATGITLDTPVSVGSLPGFAEGLASIQDCGAQYAAPMLDAQDGMHVLDACAAPGGKTGHLLELANIHLTAVDIDAARLSRVRQNLDRLGLSATLIDADIADGKAARSWWDGRPFDRILLDAPCSASGVVRRHPDGKWLRRESDIENFASMQSNMLETLWRMLARGGKLLYATCSVFPEENAERIAGFLEAHCDASLLHPANDGQLLPDRDHDGFFYALLGKQHQGATEST